MSTQGQSPRDGQFRPAYPILVSPRQAAVMLGVGMTNLYTKILPKLDSFMLGGSRKITVASIEAYVARQLAARAG